MCLLAIVFLFPLYSMISKSLMTLTEIRALPPRLLPEVLQFKNYIGVFPYEGSYHNVPYFLIYLKNTLSVVVLQTVGLLFSASLCAFGFSKIKFPGRNTLFFLVLSTMMIPGAVTMIPLYSIFNKLDWINKLYPLWVPMWFGGGAFAIFLVKQYMRTIPDALLESAKMDGAGYWRQYTQIILPNCKPVLTVLAIQSFLGAWNDLMGPLLYLNEKSKWTLALGINNMAQGSMGQVEGLSYILAACAMMTIVPMLVFMFGQKFFIESIVMTGVKG